MLCVWGGGFQIQRLLAKYIQRCGRFRRLQGSTLQHQSVSYVVPLPCHHAVHSSTAQRGRAASFPRARPCVRRAALAIGWTLGRSSLPSSSPAQSQPPSLQALTPLPLLILSLITHFYYQYRHTYNTIKAEAEEQQSILIQRLHQELKTEDANQLPTSSSSSSSTPLPPAAASLSAAATPTSTTTAAVASSPSTNHKRRRADAPGKKGRERREGRYNFTHLFYVHHLYTQQKARRAAVVQAAAAICRERGRSSIRPVP